ncbi:MAG: hypothetical protein H7Y27_13790 [Gemmatimonadaceae bacterium]|nr:hypothetical protein [Chitinophagaceae bacterium]
MKNSSSHLMHCNSKKLSMLFLFAFFSACLFSGCAKTRKQQLEQEIGFVRNAVAPYMDKKKAIADGYDTDVTGYRTQMGFHYVNGSLLDDKFELGRPELMLYAPYGNDTMKLVAVEYATPITDINNPPPPPEGFTGSHDVWEINTEFNLWTLHVWIGLENTHGIFSPHNPKLP